MAFGRNPVVEPGLHLTRAQTEGRGSPAELVGWQTTVEIREHGAKAKLKGWSAEVEHRTTVETREHGAKAELKGRRAEVESRAWWLKAETGSSHQYGAGDWKARGGSTPPYVTN